MCLNSYAFAHIYVYLCLYVFLRLFIIFKNMNAIQSIAMNYVFLITPERLQRIKGTLLYVTLTVPYKHFEII